MTDTLTYLGEESISAVLPGVSAPLLAAEADLAAKIQAFVDFKPVVALPMLAQLQIAEDIVAGFNACISAGIEPPSLGLQIKVVADALADLRLQLKVIQDLFGLMASAGVDLYAYDGTAGGLGPKVSAALASGLPSGGTSATHCNALILTTRLSATFTAMSSIFKVA